MRAYRRRRLIFISLLFNGYSIYSIVKLESGFFLYRNLAIEVVVYKDVKKEVPSLYITANYGVFTVIRIVVLTVRKVV